MKAVMKTLKRVLVYFVVLSMLVMNIPNIIAADDAQQISSGNPYEYALDSGYDGSVLVSFYAKGSSLTADVVDTDSSVITAVDFGSYVNAADYTKLSLLVYQNSGKYMIYSGENDKYCTEGTFDVKFGRMFKSVVFKSPSAAVKDVSISEFVRSYADSQKTTLLDVSYDNCEDGTEPTDVKCNVGRGCFYRYAKAGSTDDGYDYYTKDNSDIYYSYRTVTDETYGKSMRMSSKSAWADQSVKFKNGSVNGNNFEISTELLLPAMENANANVNRDMLVIFATHDYDGDGKKGYQMPIVTFKAISKTADKGAVFAAFDGRGNKIFDVPVDSENGGDKWIKLNITADLDAQKYVMTLESDGKTVNSNFGFASTFTSTLYDRYITKTLEPGYVIRTNTAYIKNYKVNSMPRGDENTMLLSEQNVKTIKADSAKIGDVSLAGGYDGSALITFYAKGNSLTADVTADDSSVITSINLNGYVNEQDYTKISLLVYQNTGKYIVYTGENDSYCAEGTFDVKFGRMFKSVVFRSETPSTSVKDAAINEFVRKYADAQKTVLLDVNYDKCAVGIEPTSVASDVGKGCFYRYTKAGTTDDGYDYYTNKDGENISYSYKTVMSETYGQSMRMSSKSKWADQSVKFSSGAIDGKNFEISTELRLPAMENKAANTNCDMLVIFATQDTGYQMPIVVFKAMSSTADEGATFAAFDGRGNKLFTVPIDSANARDKWIKLNITADIDAQKYEITLESDGETINSMLGVASSFMSARYDHYITKTLQPGYVIRTNTAYIKNYKVSSMPRGDESTMKLSEQTVRGTVSDAVMSELRDVAESLRCNTNDITNGIALDTLGLYDINISWSSSNPDVISDTGVVHPKVGEACEVTLTATLTKGISSLEKTFNITVPAVQPYVINAIKVTGDDGITDSLLVGGKEVSAVHIKRYAGTAGDVRVVCALYNGNELAGVSLNTVNTASIDQYGENFVGLTEVLKLPENLTDDYSMKVMIVDSPENMRPLAVSKDFDVQSAQPSVYLCSDSTASHYDSQQYYPRTGWGDAFANLISADKAQFKNIAVSGKSSRSFYTEGDFNALDKLNSGDIVIVQFGHNDRSSTNPIRRTTANLDSDGNIDYTKSNTYVQYLQLYINKAREKGASIVFATPPNRALLKNDLEPMCTAMKKFAQSKGIRCIDLTEQTVELFNKVNNAGGNFMDYFMTWTNQADFIKKWGSLGTFYQTFEVNTDGSHFTSSGAEAVSQIFANNIVDSGNVLSRYIDKEKLKTVDELVAAAVNN